MTKLAGEPLALPAGLGRAPPHRPDPGGGLRRPRRDADGPPGRGRRARAARARARQRPDRPAGHRAPALEPARRRAAALHLRRPARARRGDLPRAGRLRSGASRRTRRRRARCGCARPSRVTARPSERASSSTATARSSSASPRSPRLSAPARSSASGHSGRPACPSALPVRPRCGNGSHLRRGHRQSRRARPRSARNGAAGPGSDC